MTMRWDLERRKLSAFGVTFDAASDVRNELNERRPLGDPKQVVRAIVDGQYGPPYMPRPFPRGLWNITGIEISDEKDFWPIKILTDARQLVHVWSLDKNGGYLQRSDRTVWDTAYHLHFSKWSITTLGCGRVGKDSPSQIFTLAGLLYDELKHGVKLEVV
jgi:hypothetical protein